jgi:hypothetical protein
MESFEEAWSAVAVARNGESVSPQLQVLLRAVYSELHFQPVRIIALKRRLQELLQFLAGRERTNANCWAVDLFFCNCQGWEGDWGNLELPEQLHDVLAKMGEALHDTVETPDIAENFGCLPEQLLEALEANPRT